MTFCYGYFGESRNWETWKWLLMLYTLNFFSFFRFIPTSDSYFVILIISQNNYIKNSAATTKSKITSKFGHLKAISNFFLLMKVITNFLVVFKFPFTIILRNCVMILHKMSGVCLKQEMQIVQVIITMQYIM